MLWTILAGCTKQQPFITSGSATDAVATAIGMTKTFQGVKVAEPD